MKTRMNDQQREMAESLRNFNEAPRIPDLTGRGLRPGQYWAICGIVADNFGRHDADFDRNAFMTTCGF
jgi:hypothetical protein